MVYWKDLPCSLFRLSKENIETLYLRYSLARPRFEPHAFRVQAWAFVAELLGPVITHAS